VRIKGARREEDLESLNGKIKPASLRKEREKGENDIGHLVCS